LSNYDEIVKSKICSFCEHFWGIQNCSMLLTNEFQITQLYFLPVIASRPLQKLPFAQVLRQAQISILEISIYSCGWNLHLPWT